MTLNIHGVEGPGFPTRAATSASRSIDEIVAECPTGKAPHFEITSGYEDHVLGIAVYIKNGHVHNMMTDERISKKLITGLRFHGYINQP